MNSKEFILREIIDNAMIKYKGMDLVCAKDKDDNIYENHETFRGSCVARLIKDVGCYANLKALIFKKYIKPRIPCEIVDTDRIIQTNQPCLNYFRDNHLWL